MQETLIAVAVLVVLMAISFIAIGSISANLKMTELDATAREIYIAAQNRVIAMKATGDTGLPAEGSVAITQMPIDFDKDTFDWEEYQKSYYYIAGGSGAVGDFARFLPLGSIDETVRTGGYYIIEYNSITETVYSVFYAEEPFDYVNVLALATRDKDTRKDSEPRLGYYGGSDVALQVAKPTKKPVVRLVNDETLRLELTVEADTLYSISVKGKTSGAAAVVSFRTAANGVVVSEPVSSRLKAVDLGAQPLVYALTLDSLTDGMSFKKLSEDLESEGEFAPGEDVELTVTAQYMKELSTPTDSDTVSGNSLYASLLAGEAHVAYGRHLQNLEPTVSGASTAASSAVQDLPIDWSYYADVSVASGLVSGQFLSLQNTALLSYNGNGNAIKNLRPAPNGGKCGMFASVSGAALKNITLVNEIVASAQYSGGLAGQMTGGSAENCVIYVALGGIEGEEAIREFVAGYEVTGTGYVGGLIGRCDGGRISQSLYAGGRVTASGSERCYLGGLVGRAEGVTIEKSYSNTDVIMESGGYGSYCGGLVGQVSGELNNCYSSGSISGTNKIHTSYSGGFVGDTESQTRINNCYCAMEYNSGGTTGNPFVMSIAAFCTIRSGLGLSVSNSFYLEPKEGTFTQWPVLGLSSRTYAELKKLTATLDGTGATWTQATVANTKPYELKGSYYPFPRLTSNFHYGDWILPDLDPIQMAYYEVYEDGSLGIFNIDDLAYNNLSDTKTVVQDGYMLLLEKDLNGDSSMNVKYEDLYKKNSIVAKGGKNLDGTNASPDAIKINGNDISLTFNGTPVKYDKASVISIHNRSYYPFFLHYTQVVSNIEQNVVSELQIKNGTAAWGENKWEDIYFIPAFAKSKISSESFTLADLKAEDRFLYIRTERHLATLATYKTSGDAANIRGWWDDGLELRQERDLVFGKDNPYTTTYLGATMDENYRDTIDGIGYVNAGEPTGTGSYKFTGVYDGGIYDDDGRLVTGENAHSVTGASIAASGTNTAAWYKGLFSNVSGGEIKNLTLDNVTVNPAHNYSCAFSGVLLAYGKDAKLSNIKVTDCSVFGNQVISGVAGKVQNSSLTNIEVADCDVTGYRVVGGVVGQLQLAAGETIAINTVSIKDSAITSGDLNPTTDKIDYNTNSDVASSDGSFGTGAVIGNTGGDSGAVSLRDISVTGITGKIYKTQTTNIASGMLIGNYTTSKTNTLTVENAKIENSSLDSALTSGSARYGVAFGKLGLSDGTMQVTLNGLTMTNNSVTLSGGGGAEVGGLVGKAYSQGVMTITLPNEETLWEIPNLSFAADDVSNLGGVIGIATTGVKLTYAGENGSLVIYKPEAVLAASGSVGGFAGQYAGGGDYPLSNISVTLQSVESTADSAGGFIGGITASPLNNINVTVSENVKADKNAGGLVSETTAAASDITINLGGGVTSKNGAAGGLAASANTISNSEITLHGVSAKNNAGGVAGTASGAVSNVELAILGETGVTSEAGACGGGFGSCQGQVTNVTAVIGGDIKGYGKTGGFAGELTSTLGVSDCKLTITGTKTGDEVTGGVISAASGASGFTPGLVGPSSGNEVRITGSVKSKVGDTGGYAGTMSGYYAHKDVLVDITGSVTTESGMAGGACANVSAGTVKLDAIDVYIGGDVTGTDNTGGFAGTLGVGVTDCYTDVKGTISTTGDYVGGFVGISSAKLENAAIDNSKYNDEGQKTTVSALGSDTVAGGFAGKLEKGATSCCAKDIIVNGVGGDIGGFVGVLTDKATDCYVKGLTIKNDGFGNTGGFIPVIESTTQIVYSTDTDEESVCPVSDCDITGNGEYTGGYAGKIAKALTYARVDNTSVKGGKYVGGFAGFIDNVSVTNCDVRLSDSVNTGEIKHTVSGDSKTDYCGGFAGMIKGTNAKISNSFAAINVSGGDFTGGFVGKFENGTINTCYATGTVTDGGRYAGGFAGHTTGDKVSSLITACYATGNVTGKGCSGGFVGYVEMGVYYSCYSLGRVSGGTAGGFVGGRSYVQDYSNLKDAFASLVVLMKNGVKVTNRQNCGVKYLTDSDGNYVYNQLGERVLDTSDCQDLFTFAKGFTLDSGASIIEESNLVRNENGTVKKDGTRIQNAFNKLKYYTTLNEVLSKTTWQKIKDKFTIVWAEEAVNDPGSITITENSGSGKDTKAYPPVTKNNVSAWQIDTSGNIYSGKTSIKVSSNTEYTLYNYNYNILDGIKNPGGKDTIGDVTMVGVCYLTGDNYNVNMPDGDTSSVDVWTGSDFNREVMGATEYFTGFVTVNRSHPYSDEISTFAYPAARNVGSDAGEYSAEHWGDWPESESSSGYVAYYEKYSNGTIGYYSQNGHGGALINTLTDGEITDFGCCYLANTEGGADELKVSNGSGNYQYSAQSSGTVTITFIKQSEDHTTEYNESFNIYYLNESSQGQFYETVMINGRINQYNSHLAKAAVTGERQGDPTGYIRCVRQLENMGTFTDSGNVFILERDLDAGALYFGSFAARLNGGGHALTANGRLFGDISGSVSGLTVNLTGIADTSGFALTNNGAIQRCAVIGAVSGNRAAGFVDVNSGDIEQCYYSGDVTASAGNGAGFVNENTGSITNCFAVGAVSASEITGDELTQYSASGFAATGGDRVSSSYCAMALTAPLCVPFSNGAGDNCWYLDCGSSFNDEPIKPDPAAIVFGQCVNDDEIAFAAAFSASPWSGSYQLKVTTYTTTEVSGYEKPADFAGDEGWTQVIPEIEDDPVTWLYTSTDEGVEAFFDMPTLEAPAFIGTVNDCGRYVFETAVHEHDMTGPAEEIAGDDANHNKTCIDPLCDHTEAEPHTYGEPDENGEKTCSACGHKIIDPQAEQPPEPEPEQEPVPEPDPVESPVPEEIIIQQTPPQPEQQPSPEGIIILGD